MVLNLPEGSSLEDTERTLFAAAAHRARSCRRCVGCRPMPAPPRRSTSTAWCGTTTCGSRRNWATCRSTWRRRRIARAAATPSRSTCASACSSAAAAGGHVQGGGSAARAAGAGDAAGRDLRPRRRDAPRGGARGEGAVRPVPYHRRCRRLLRPSAAAPAHRDRSGRAGVSSASSSPTSTTRSRRCSAACAWAIRIAARNAPDRDPHRPAEARAELEPAPGGHAGAGQYAAGQQDRGGAWPGRAGRPASSARRCCSAATGISPTW